MDDGGAGVQRGLTPLECREWCRERRLLAVDVGFPSVDESAWCFVVGSIVPVERSRFL